MDPEQNTNFRGKLLTSSHSHSLAIRWQPDGHVFQGTFAECSVFGAVPSQGGRLPSPCRSVTSSLVIVESPFSTFDLVTLELVLTYMEIVGQEIKSEIVTIKSNQRRGGGNGSFHKMFALQV